MTMSNQHDSVVEPGAEQAEATPDAIAETTDAVDSVQSTEGSLESAAGLDAQSENVSDGEDETDEEADGSGQLTRRGGRAPRVADLEREGEVAADFLETLLDIADLDGDIEVDVDGDRAAVAIVDSDEGRVPRRLVGPDGKVLDALQELTRLAVQSATGERSRLMLDVAGHRAERRAALVEVAQHAIAEVKASGHKTSLEPMSAFERKVVHDEVLAAGLVSQSDGVEPNRYVVVLPA
jgi:spoIIIJ-associated protein